MVLRATKYMISVKICQRVQLISLCAKRISEIPQGTKPPLSEAHRL